MPIESTEILSVNCAGCILGDRLLAPELGIERSIEVIAGLGEALARNYLDRLEDTPTRLP